jgi:acyl-CoA thioester hydrolase
VPFVHIHRVRYVEVDAQGVVFNAHYLTFCDDAMTRFFASLGYDPKETFTEGGAFDVMLVRSVVEWRSGAGFEDDLAIEVVPSRLGGSSFDITYTMRVGDREVAEVVTTYVSVVPGEHRSCPIPDEVRDRLAAQM